MTRALRLARLSWTMNRSSRLKMALLCLLTAVGISAFLWLTELSRSSIDSLDSAVQAELGTQGQYTVAFRGTLGLTPEALIGQVSASLVNSGAMSIIYVEQTTAVTPQCPPYQAADQVGLAVFRDASGAFLPFNPAPLPEQFDLCLAGQVIPASAVRETSQTEKRAIGYSLVVAGPYRPLAVLATGDAPQLTAIVTFPDEADNRARIKSALDRVLAEPAAHVGVPLTAAFTVFKVNDGQQVRAASQGVRLVYGLIAWGVLLLIGLGLLIAQLFALKDRAWLLGLARAVGARRSDLAMLVVAEVVAITFAGVALAAIASIALQPFAQELGKQAFNTDLQILRWSALTQLAPALSLSMALGAAYPAIRALRLDPLDVLEKR